METCIAELREWMRKNKLMINDGKTEVILIGTRQQLAKVSFENIVVGESTVTAAESIRNLETWFDSRMSMETHVNRCCKAAFYHLHNLNKIRKYLNQETTEKLIHAFVTSRIDYCNALLYGLPKNLLHKLQRVQNAAARLVFREPKFCRITPLLFNLHWLPIRHRIHFKIILVAFKAIHNLAPQYITNLVTVKPRSSYNLRSSNELLLMPPSVKTYTTLGDRAFSASAPKLWNSLPLYLRNITNINIFKKNLKTYLFNQAFI